MTQEITRANLSQFTGTEHWYRYYPGILVTDGVKFLMDNGAAWFIDLIVSYQGEAKVKAEEKQFWTLTVDHDALTGRAVCTDGDKGDGPVTLIEQVIDFTDFPLKEITLYAFVECNNRVILLPSEY